MKYLTKLFGVAAAVGACVLASVPARATVIAYWKFEGGVSTRGLDSSGNGYHLTEFGGVAFSSSVAPLAASQNGSTQSASFDGSDDILYTTLNLALSTYNALTVEWYMLGDWLGGDGVIFESSDNYNSGAGRLGGFISGSATMTANKRVSGGYQVDTYTFASNAEAEQWHHVAAIFDRFGSGNKVYMYVDGVLVGSDTLSASGTDAFANETWRIGRRGAGGVAFKGLIDEMRISAGVLSPDQFLNFVPVPEPSTALLLGVGGWFLFRAYRRRKQTA